MNTLLTYTVIVIFQGQADPNQHGETLRFLKNAYQANRETMAFGRVHFKETVGFAPTLDDARSGKSTQSTTAAGFFAFDAANARFERTMPEAELLSATRRVSENTVSSPLQCLRGLTDGQSALVELITVDADLKSIIKTTQIFPVKDLYGEFFFPLDLGHPAPKNRHLPDDIDGILDGSLKLLKFDATARYEGRDVIHFVIGMENGERAYWVDPERGAVPLLIREHVTASGHFLYVANDNIHKESNGAWMPRIKTLLLEKPGSGGQFRSVVVSDVHVTQPPDQATFRLDFAKPFPLVDTVRKVRHHPKKTWGLTDLSPSASSRAVPIRMVSEGPPMPSMPGERDPQPAWLYAVWAVAIVLFIGGGWRLLRALRKRR